MILTFFYKQKRSQRDFLDIFGVSGKKWVCIVPKLQIWAHNYKYGTIIVKLGPIYDIFVVMGPYLQLWVHIYSSVSIYAFMGPYLGFWVHIVTFRAKFTTRFQTHFHVYHLQQCALMRQNEAKSGNRLSHPIFSDIFWVSTYLWDDNYTYTYFWDDIQDQSYLVVKFRP